MNADSRKIENILVDHIERAKKAFEIAKANFVTVTSDVPSAIPQPDGIFRLEKAGKDFRFTMEDYSLALREFNNFITDGMLPDHLREPEDRESPA